MRTLRISMLEKSMTSFAQNGQIKCGPCRLGSKKTQSRGQKVTPIEEAHKIVLAR